MARRPRRDQPQAGKTVITGLNCPRDLLALLRVVAMKRAKERGGRPSVIALIVELIRERRTDLETEAGPWLEMIKKGLL